MESEGWRNGVIQGVDLTRVPAEARGLTATGELVFQLAIEGMDGAPMTVQATCPDLDYLLRVIATVGVPSLAHVPNRPCRVRLVAGDVVELGNFMGKGTMRLRSIEAELASEDAGNGVG